MNPNRKIFSVFPSGDFSQYGRTDGPAKPSTGANVSPPGASYESGAINAPGDISGLGNSNELTNTHQSSYTEESQQFHRRGKN